jgi:hypothetical protein
MQFKKQLITPAIAKKYLELNLNNRRPKKAVLLRYTNEMIEGRWKEDTGEVIKISKKGIVLDGQHRLMAVVKSGVSINFHLAIDVEDSVFDVLDTGSLRNASDAFEIKGINQQSSIPSIISTYLIFKENKNKGSQKQQRATTAELLKAYYEREVFWQGIGKKSHNWYITIGKILPPSIIGGLYAVFTEINETDAQDFFERLCTGFNILEGDSIGLLKNKLVQNHTSVRKMKTYERNALIIKTWNYHRNKETVKLLKFNTIQEAFPFPL